jgi:hypothetical protein
MSSAAVRPLRDVRMADATEVGGKAAGLGELSAAGVRVPDGVVITAAVADLSAAWQSWHRPVRRPIERDLRGRRRTLLCRHVRIGPWTCPWTTFRPPWTVARSQPERAIDRRPPIDRSPVSTSPTVSPRLTPPVVGSSGRRCTVHGAVISFSSVLSHVAATRSASANPSVTQKARCTPTVSAPPMPPIRASPYPAPSGRR